MTPEKDAKLCEDFPRLLKARGLSKQESCMYWGFECDDGWFDLIYNLCVELKAFYEAMPLTQQQIYKDTFIAAQVKEKFGGLRFYLDGGPEEAYKLIDAAEAKSYTICEVCGETGEVRRGGWIKTLCEKHHLEREASRKRQ